METFMPHQSMLILRGIAGTYDGIYWPRGALYEKPALEYASRQRYTGRVLDVAGAAYENSPQVVMALAEFRRDSSVAAFYGFSGGGYNVLHIIKALTADERDRVQLVVVLGSPKNPSSLYEASRFNAHWELVYRLDPPKQAGGHMGGPEALLKETPAGRYRDRPDGEED